MPTWTVPAPADQSHGRGGLVCGGAGSGWPRVRPRSTFHPVAAASARRAGPGPRRSPGCGPKAVTGRGVGRPRRHPIDTVAPKPETPDAKVPSNADRLDRAGSKKSDPRTDSLEGQSQEVSRQRRRPDGLRPRRPRRPHGRPSFWKGAIPPEHATTPVARPHTNARTSRANLGSSRPGLEPPVRDP